jgi:RNA recognition motif-containing protein
MKKLYIGGLDPSTSSQELTERFEKFGKVLRVSLPIQKSPLSAYAFIDIDITDQNYVKCTNV